MTTITLQLGNSDDRLSQTRWHAYVEAVRVLLEHSPGIQVHFFGAPPNWAPWQNVAWVFTAPLAALPDLKTALSEIRQDYAQDSIAWTQGETNFI
jgi:hypothetical protein